MKVSHVTATPVHATLCSRINFRFTSGFEGVAQWCNPLILHPELSGADDSIPGRAPSLERHDRGR